MIPELPEAQFLQRAFNPAISKGDSGTVNCDKRLGDV